MFGGHVEFNGCNVNDLTAIVTLVYLKHVLDAMTSLFCMNAS